MSAETERETNKRLARQVPEEIATKRNYEFAEELFAADLLEHGPFGEDVRGREAWLEQMRGLVEAVPDFSATVEDVVAEDDLVAMRVTFRGTQEGEFMGREPTGRSFEVQNMVFTRFEDGRIVERWVQADTFDMMEQLGHIERS
jgi:steroid delta-isomerase-like uncharacterized protein